MPRLYFEDVEVSSEIPALVKNPTTKQLVNWAVSTQDPARIHYDKDRAQMMKLPGTVVHGLLKHQWFVQMLSRWIGDDGDVKKVACRFYGMDLPGDTVTCRGKVTKKYVADGQGWVECEVWLGNEREEKTTLGTATVVLPQRG